MTRKRFADNAGFTRHCWECIHSGGWHRVDSIEVQEGVCELTGRRIGKYDSPNNQVSHLPIECSYKEDA